MKGQLNLNQTEVNEPDQNYIPTFSGGKLHFLNPLPEEIRATDIIHSLARLPRYLGHTKHTIMVAEHTVRMVAFLSHMLLCGKEGIRYCLLHDSPEAYLGEWPKPLKESVVSGELKDREHNLLMCILYKYGCSPSKGEIELVGKVDRGIVHAETELSQNMPDHLLPMKLTEGDKMIGRDIHETLCRVHGWKFYGWTTNTAECRLREWFESYRLMD